MVVCNYYINMSPRYTFHLSAPYTQTTLQVFAVFSQNFVLIAVNKEAAKRFAPDNPHY